MSPTTRPCHRHHKIMVACPDCMAGLRAKLHQK